ncbi:hypothetical protein GGF31_003146 [Allomyces arbusculus]|nr:hypothetical protein GGF31_003146 [Allomyces arbusculus]
MITTGRILLRRAAPSTISTPAALAATAIRGYSAAAAPPVPPPHRFARRKHPALMRTPAPTVEEAVTNILYNTPQAGSAPVRRHVLNCLVTDEPGVLSRVSGILAARGFNIDSLVVSKTDVKQLSRMTIALKGQGTTVEQAIKQLEDLVPVWAVLDLSPHALIEREMLLAKVNIVPHQIRDQYFLAEADLVEADAALDRSHKDGGDAAADTDRILQGTHQQLHAVTNLAKLFNAKVVDVASETVVVELCAKSDRINAFLKLLNPFGLVEVARSGMMAMTRTPVDGVYESEVEEELVEAVDLASLPPS